jgi:hypothetical protein
MNDDLGRLAPVDPRHVWPSEAQDFTPWLLANADVLSRAVGMDLALEVAEHAVGDFSLDLIGTDRASGGRVIVENQLEVSDHQHLGQILTYAAGTDPTHVVWLPGSVQSIARRWSGSTSVPTNAAGSSRYSLRWCASAPRRRRRC